MSVGIFILGVPSKFRGKALEEQIKGFGLSYTLVEGIDGTTLDAEASLQIVDRAISEARYGREITVAEACCTLGHRRVAEHLIESPYDWALVLEDDAVLSVDPRQIYSLIQNRMTNTIIQIYWNRAVPRIRDLFHPQKQLFQVVSGGSSTVAYLMDKVAAHTILRNSSQNSTGCLADWPHTWNWRVKFYASTIRYVGTADDQSIIGETRRINDTKNLRSFQATVEIFKRFFRLMKAGETFSNSFHGFLLLELSKQFSGLIIKLSCRRKLTQS